MRRVERQTQIAAPAEQIFAFVSELDNLARWQSGIVSTEKLTAEPVGSGSRARVVRELMGQRIAADLEVTDYEPPRRLGLHSEVSGVHARGEIVIEPAGPERSSLTFSMEISASGFAAFMEGMVASAAEKDITDSLERLRRELEGPVSAD